jgi:hypothetical protein
MKPRPTWATLTSTATAIPMPASTAIRGGAKRPDDRHGRALRDIVAEARGPGWVAGRSARRSLSSPQVRAARAARRTPRRSACPPGSAHPGPTRPHHGRNRKPSFEQEDNSSSWRSSCSRLSDPYHPERVSHVSNVLDTGPRHHCRMPPASDDICHGPSGWAPSGAGRLPHDWPAGGLPRRVRGRGRGTRTVRHPAGSGRRDGPQGWPPAGGRAA